MKAIKLFLIIVVILQTSFTTAQSFIVCDVVISDTTSSLLDPEIDWFGHHYCWANEQGIWVGNIDSVTGNFIPNNGKGILIDSTPSYRGMKAVANGPEWAISKNGSLIIYPDSVDDKIIQIGTAKLVNTKWVAQPLPNSYGRIPFFGSYDNTYLKDGITCASYNITTLQPTGMRLRNTSDTTEIIPPDMSGGRWIKGLYAISLSQEKQAPYEVGYFDANTKKYTKIANFQTEIDQAWVIPVEEYNTYALWCIEKKTDQDEIAIFIKYGNFWKKFDSIRIPTDRKEIFSPEPFFWNGQPYIFLVARPRQGQPQSLYDQVWIVGLDPQNRLFRMISEAAPMNRTDPEVFYTTKEPVIYYTESRKDGRKIIHKCATGLAADIHTYEKSPFREMVFSKDYFPGTNDIYGRYLGSTETMTIIQHKGKLYAGMGNWMDYPWDITGKNEGSQILRKDSFNSPWVVDTSLGYRSMRTEAVLSVTFDKDFSGNTLSQPVNLLVCGAGDISIDRPREITIWVRDDINGIWKKNTGFTVTKGSAGIRSFKIHTDKVTGKQFLFAGMVEGDIIKVQYNPGKYGWLEIDTTRELRGMGRVMAMCECNGDLYAAAGVDLVGKDTAGGLYRRIDGENPSWELIYRWPYNALDEGDETNIMRGITCIPDPKGTGKDVIVGTRAYPGVVEIIEPHNNHKIYTELYIKSFFSSQWDINYNRGVSLSAYNYFVPDTIDSEEIWWQSLWVENPKNSSHPYNGSHFLVRFKDGTYQYGDIFDNKNPVPNGKNLRACRTICKSPFPEEPNTYYFGGYDCASDTSNNTSWIYKGVITGGTSVDDVIFKDENFIIYPNPTNTTLFIKTENNNSLQYQISNSIGQVIQQEQLNGNSIDVSNLQRGFYFIQLKDENGNLFTSKFIKE